MAYKVPKVCEGCKRRREKMVAAANQIKHSATRVVRKIKGK